MTREEFTALISDENDRIKRAKQEIERLKEVYIIATCPHKVGDKIKITTPSFVHHEKTYPEKERFAFIYKLSVSDKGEIHYSIFKSKKDGSQSMHNDYIGYKETIEGAPHRV